MAAIIFLPGILGSRLFLGEEEVWPPTAWETQFGYDRIGQLTDPAATAGDPIDSVLCFDFYRPIIDDLADIASGNAGAPACRFHNWGYDWRQDIADIAADVAARIDALPDADRAELRFVGHSMGCLVFRVILESGLYTNRAWFGSVKSFTALAGPHLGAPAALVRVLGLEGTLGLAPDDIRRIGADPRYPALYQLLPAPGIAALWNVKGGAMTELDLYDPAVADRLGLHAGNLEKAKALHGILSRNDRPDHVEYVYLAGTGNDTWLRVDVSGSRLDARMGKDAGDGMVPLWSAVDPSRVHHAAPATHEAVFKSEQIRMLLYRSLGARPPAVAFSGTAGKPLLSLFAGRTIYALAVPVQLMLVPAVAAKLIAGDLVIAHSDGQGTAFQVLERVPLNCGGADIEQLKVRLPPMPRPGFYKVTFEGSHQVAEDGAAMFGVSEARGGAAA